MLIASSPPPSRVPLLSASDDAPYLTDLAQRFGLDLADPSAISPTQPRLHFFDDRLHLEWQPATEREVIRSCIDFATEQRHRRGHATDLTRAIGNCPRTVLDATAGWGRDAYHLAQLGYRVVAYERHPAISALLSDAHRRALDNPDIGPVVSERLEFRFGEARTACEEVSAESIYLDPMFPPPRRPKALPKKELQLLRAVVPYEPVIGAEEKREEGDSAGRSELLELLDRARSSARDRVVLKRPHHVKPFAGARHRYRTKLVCYDVFGATV